MTGSHEPSIRIHECLVAVGWIDGAAASRLAYWTMRLADEISRASVYDAARRQLIEFAWNNVRPVGTSTNVVSSAYPRLVSDFLARHGHRFAERYQQTVRAIRSTLDEIESPTFPYAD